MAPKNKFANTTRMCLGRGAEEIVKERGTSPRKVVTKHVVSLTYFQEFPRCFVIIWIDIGMVEFGQLENVFVQKV